MDRLKPVPTVGSRHVPSVGTGFSLCPQKRMNEIDQLFADFTDALRRGDCDALAELVTDDAEFWSHGVAAMKGRDHVRTSMRDACEKYVVERSWDEVERLTGDGFAVSVGIERTRATPRAG